MDAVRENSGMGLVSMFIMIACSLLAVAGVAEPAERTIFGPVKYEVKERYGAENRYTAAFKAPEGLVVVMLRNGDTWPERPDVLGFSLNGKEVLREARYEHPVIATFARLPRENTFEIVVKDAKPSGMRRPKPTPKFTTLSVVRSPISGVEGSFGGVTYDLIVEFVKTIKRITKPDALAAAVTAAGLQNEHAVRAEAIRKLCDMKERSSLDFLTRLYQDIADAPEVRAEAALAIAALGDVRSIPALISGVLNPDERIRTASARALSSYPEDQTRDPLVKMLESLDPMRKGAFMRALADGGWRPFGVLISLAKSQDGRSANMAVEILGGLQDPRAPEFLLGMLNEPGTADLRTVIAALGHSRSSAAVAPLIAVAMDPVKRQGREAELGEALAEIGDKNGAEAISVMIKNAKDGPAKFRLLQAYKKLTGKDY
jgi:HEAT repeat protein